MAEKKSAAAASQEKGKSRIPKNPEAEAKNYEQTCKTETEAPHKWNETWGQLFFKGVPFEYPERIAHLENELKQLGGNNPPPKFGTGERFKDATLVDFRRKKMFRDPSEE